MNSFFNCLRNVKNNRKLYKYLLVALVCMISMLTVAYAALNAVLEITGNAEVVASSWDIYLDNAKVTSGSVTTAAPTITNNTTVNFSATLNNPGDFYEFTIDAVNNGSIDAMIDSVTKTPLLTEIQSKYLNYVIEYENGNAISSKQLVESNSFVRLKVRVEFRKDVVASDLPSTSETLNLAFTVNYVQSDDTTGIIVPGKGIIKVVSGDGTETSDEVCIGEECFYVMYSDEASVTMLSKYNLYVGNECTTNDSSTCRPYGDEATGKQYSNMLGYVSGQSIRKGTTKFSNTNYWLNTVSNYPVYVYDSNSVLYSYVENYKTYLSTLGVTPTDVRLITKEELESLGCSSSGYSCSGAPGWIYATTYWSGTASSSSNVWNVYCNGNFNNNYNYSNNYGNGCRPVIVIDRSLI